MRDRVFLSPLSLSLTFGATGVLDNEGILEDPQPGSDQKCRIKKKFGRTARKVWSAPQLFFTMPRLETSPTSDEETNIFGSHLRKAPVKH